jgi:hypothetical protein
MDKTEKEKVIKKLIAEVYTDYLRHLAVYKFIGEKFRSDMAEDTDPLRKQMAETKAKQLELMKKIKDKEITDSEKEIFSEEFNQTGADISKLDSRIEFIENKVADFANAKRRVNETVDHYNRLKNWLEKDEAEEEPEYVK